MKIIKYLVIISLIYSFSLTHAVEICSKPWRIGVSDRFPFESYVNGIPSGLNVDIMNKVAEKLKCKVEFYDLPFTRIIYETKQGNNDIIMGIGRRQEREEFGYYLTPYLNKPSVLITMKNKADTFKNFKLQDLNQRNYKFSIGVVLGIIYSKEYEKLLLEPEFVKHLEKGTKNHLNLKKLFAGRIDAIIVSDIIVAKRLIRNSENKEYFKIIPIEKEDFSYFLYSKKTFTLTQAKEIDEKLQKIVSSKEMNSIMLKYFKNDEINLIKVN